MYTVDRPTGFYYGINETVANRTGCGTPPRWRAIIGMLSELESLPVATYEELLVLIDRRDIGGRGCGYVDVSLFVSCSVTKPCSGRSINGLRPLPTSWVGLIDRLFNLDFVLICTPCMYNILYAQGLIWDKKKKFAGLDLPMKICWDFRMNRGKGQDLNWGKVQAGLELEDWKPFDDVGRHERNPPQGCPKVSTESCMLPNSQRQFMSCIAFRRKTEVTTKHDKDIAETRYRAVVRERKAKK